MEMPSCLSLPVVQVLHSGYPFFLEILFFPVSWVCCTYLDLSNLEMSWKFNENMLFGVMSCARMVQGSTSEETAWRYSDKLFYNVVYNSDIYSGIVQVSVDMCVWFQVIYSLFSLNYTWVQFYAKPPKLCWSAQILNNISDKKEQNLPFVTWGILL